jgi:hypothetical protein
MIIFQSSCWFQQGNNIDILQEVVMYVLNLILKYSNLGGGDVLGGMDVCLRSFCVSVRQRDLATGLFVVRSVLSNTSFVRKVLRLSL